MGIRDDCIQKKTKRKIYYNQGTTESLRYKN